MIEWVIIIAIVCAMYIVIYKYEKKMDELHQLVKENKEKIDSHNEKITKNRKHIDDNNDRINTNHSRLEKHHSHIERMWITIPKNKIEKD